MVTETIASMTFQAYSALKAHGVRVATWKTMPIARILFIS